MNNNIERIKKEIPSTIKLLVVSKGVNIDNIDLALKGGHLFFGENRVPEAKIKWQILKKKYPTVKLHLIGRLQTNKVRDAVALFDVIETVDSYKLADKLALEIVKQNKEIDIFIQVNIGNESQKSGIAIEQVEVFVNYCKERALNIKGLMCIPPKNLDPKVYFIKLQQLACRLDIKELSMGMSTDYKQAIECGATEIRLGTIIWE